MDNSQLVVFTLGKCEYAIKIHFAQEIMRIPSLIKMPNTPQFLEGVFNLRGKAIPVFDLKRKFQLAETEQGIDSRLLILDLDGMKLGIIVDDVSEVMTAEKQSIESFDDEIAGIGKNTIEGVCMIEDRIIILLNGLKLKSDLLKLDLERENEV